MKKLPARASKSNVQLARRRARPSEFGAHVEHCLCGAEVIRAQLLPTHGGRVISVTVEKLIDVPDGHGPGGDIALTLDLIERARPPHATPVANGTIYRLHQPHCEPNGAHVAAARPRKRRPR